MTDIELARQLFAGMSTETSTSNASILTGTALSNSSGGRVLVLVTGAQGNQINRGVTLPCTFSVAAGDTVIITLYGEDGHGKKGFVSGKIGEGGGGDISGLETRVTTLEGEVSSLDGQVTSLSSSVSALDARWGFFDVGTLSAGSQLTGRGIWKFMSIGGTVLSHWPSGQNVGDYTGICFDYNPLGYATMIATSPRTNTIFLLKKWAGEFDYVRAV